MRFSTRGLLLLTTVAAVYSASIAVLRQREALDLGFNSTDLIMFVVGVSIVWPMVRARRSLGPNAAKFRRRFATAPHFVVSLGIGVFAWFHRGPEDAFHFWLYFPIIVAYHTDAEIATCVFVGDSGVIAGAKLLRWEDYDFSIEGERIACAPKHYSRERKTQRYTVVGEDIPELRELLAAKQAAKQENHGSLG